MIALVTTIVAFVYPNVSKLYNNYKNQALYYDQTEDLFFLKAIYDANKKNIDKNWVSKNSIKKGNTSDDIFKSDRIKHAALEEYGFNHIYIYLCNYMDTYSSDDYNFNRYLKRVKKTTYDNKAYRLVGVFELEDGTTRYASIKIKLDSENGG